MPSVGYVLAFVSVVAHSTSLWRGWMRDWVLIAAASSAEKPLTCGSTAQEWLSDIWNKAGLKTPCHPISNFPPLHKHGLKMFNKSTQNPFLRWGFVWPQWFRLDESYLATLIKLCFAEVKMSLVTALMKTTILCTRAELPNTENIRQAVSSRIHLAQQRLIHQIKRDVSLVHLKTQRHFSGFWKLLYNSRKVSLQVPSSNDLISPRWQHPGYFAFAKQYGRLQ